MLHLRRIFIHMLSCLALTAYGDDGDAIVQMLSSANQSLTTISGTLIQRTSRRDEPTEPVKELNARFAIALPNRYELVFTRTDDEEWRQRLCSDGTKRWRFEQSFADQVPDMHVESGGDDDIRRLVACLHFDAARLREEFTITAVASGNGHQATLKPLPTATRLSTQIDTIVVDFTAEHRLKRLTIDDPQGNRYEVTIVTAEYGKPLADERFRGDPGP
jgi:outer membrane lipoprotein-sorting protein